MNTTPRAQDEHRDEQRVHRIISPRIGCPRRRKPARVGAVAERCREVLAPQGVERGWEMLALALHPDPMPGFVRVGPSASAAAAVR